MSKLKKVKNVPVVCKMAKVLLRARMGIRAIAERETENQDLANPDVRHTGTFICVDSCVALLHFGAI
jgi:hypothetical protein